MKIFLKYYLPLILWVFLIFILSGIPNLKSGLVDVYDLILRKAAHIFEYAILAILILRIGLRKEKDAPNKKIVFIMTLIFGVFYAFLDEYHQSFIVGRSSSLYDTLIDSIGIVLGSGLYLSVKKD
ncbi:MAG: VanZ family protein [Patescibacteria group bacterium]|nr:VanZ family protein [Patescibacteria group bacterium]